MQSVAYARGGTCAVTGLSCTPWCEQVIAPSLDLGYTATLTAQLIAASSTVKSAEPMLVGASRNVAAEDVFEEGAHAWAGPSPRHGSFGNVSMRTVEFYPLSDT